jgi:regulator of protease activity HflC (stomatin/prohibitin superfamily)
MDGFKKIGALLLVVVGLVSLFVVLPQLVETNESGNYQVKQAAFTGEMSVINSPGTYSQMFGNIGTYPVSDIYYFSESKLDGGDSESAAPVLVTFNGGGSAKISGSFKYRLSLKDTDQLLLHQDFRIYENVKHDIIRQVVQEALTKTAATMKAEESYSSRVAEFTSLAESQIVDGIYQTISEQLSRKDTDGNELTETAVRLLKDEKGHPIVGKISPLKRYNIEVINFTIKTFDYDVQTKAIIAKKQESEQGKIVSRANAEQAKQQAITEKEQGNARVAKAEADALVIKKTAVIEAEQETAVAVQAKLKAAEESEALLVTARATATANRLKVDAGLTPQERANFEMKTKIGVAAELAKTKFPDNMIISGGSGSNGSSSPMEALGMNALYDLSQKMSKKAE